MAAALMLIGFFVWIAENIATFFGAWEYAHQHNGWQMVSYQKVSSWMLMVVVSFIIVAELKWVKERRAVSAPEGKLEWEEALYE